jgi:large subunit ribosomal protein L17
MRHGKKFNHLKRKSAHRKALMRNMASALIEHKRINTTLAKAKALRQYVEPLVTKAKANTTHSRRVVFTYLHNKEAVTELFGPVADAVAERPGGYTRVIRTGFRKSDGAEMAMIEFVDFNEVYEGGKSTGTGGGRSRRRRRGGRGGSSTGTETAATQTKKQTPKSDEEE